MNRLPIATLPRSCVYVDVPRDIVEVEDAIVEEETNICIRVQERRIKMVDRTTTFKTLTYRTIAYRTHMERIIKMNKAIVRNSTQSRQPTQRPTDKVR